MTKIWLLAQFEVEFFNSIGVYRTLKHKVGKQAMCLQDQLKGLEVKAVFEHNSRDRKAQV